MGYIKFALDDLNIKPNAEINGHVIVDYPGVYDGIVINTLIMDSNELIVYKSYNGCLLYTSPSPRDAHESRMPSSA